jgi:two-component system chemotaxis response regulator CheY
VSKSCLVVDDSRVVRKVARRIAEDMGFACAEAENGEIAAEACAESMPDVILLDWNMPKMSGMEFLERLRAMDNGGHARVVLCTTESDMDNIHRALRAGADEYIMKPFDGDIVRQKFSAVGVWEGTA